MFIQSWRKVWKPWGMEVGAIWWNRFCFSFAQSGPLFAPSFHRPCALSYGTQFVNALFVKAGNECIQNQFLSYNEDLIDRTGCDCRADCGGTHFFASETRNSYTDKSLADIDKYISQVTFLLSNNMIFKLRTMSCTMTDFVYYYPKIMSLLFRGICMRCMKNFWVYFIKWP